MTPEQTALLNLMLGLVTLAGTVWVGWYATHTGKRSTDQSTAVDFAGKLIDRVGTLEQQVRDLWAAREADAIVKRAQGDHIDLLEDHIWRQLPPPPPVRPPGL